MQHPNTGPVATPRLRPSPTPTSPAPGGAGGRKTIIPVRVYSTEDDGLPFAGHTIAPVLFNWTGPITADLRNRIVRDVEMLIAFLDALDAPTADLEPDQDDWCEAGDDDPASSVVPLRSCCSAYGPGDPEDAEWSGDECEPTPDDMPCRLPAAAITPHGDQCCNGPFQLDSTTYAAVRGWRTPGRRV